MDQYSKVSTALKVKNLLAAVCTPVNKALIKSSNRSARCRIVNFTVCEVCTLVAVNNGYCIACLSEIADCPVVVNKCTDSNSVSISLIIIIEKEGMGTVA